MRTGVAIALLATVLCACGTTKFEREFGLPVRADEDAQKRYLTLATAGDCVWGEPVRKEGFDIAPIAGSAVASLVKQGLDAIGTALNEAAKENVTPLSAMRNIEVNPTNLPRCVQIWRGWLYANKDMVPHEEGGSYKIPDLALDGAQMATLVERLGIFPAEAPDLFMEVWLRHSETGANIAITPMLLSYNRTLDTAEEISDPRGLKATIEIRAAGSTTATSSGELTLGRFGPTPLYKFQWPDKPCSSAQASATADNTGPGGTAPIGGNGQKNDATPPCSTKFWRESAWLANPFSPRKAPPPGQSPATRPDNTKDQAGSPSAPDDTHSQPFTVTVNVSETRPENKTLKVLATVFTDTRAAIETELKQELIASEREKEARERQAAQVAALTKATTSYVAAEKALVTYCSTAFGDSAADLTKHLELSSALYTSQLTANIDAANAGKPQPYVSNVAVVSKNRDDNKKVCT